MPPRRRAKVAATPSSEAPNVRARTRTYHSTSAPKQQQFPARHRIVKTYGRAPSSARSLRQQTLTQFDKLHQLNKSDDADNELLLDDEVEQEVEKPRKRRRTLGDTPSSSFHTQTLTQMLSGSSGEGEGKHDESGLDMLLPAEAGEDWADLALEKPSTSWEEPKKPSAPAQESDDSSLTWPDSREPSMPAPADKEPSLPPAEFKEPSVPASATVPHTPSAKRRHINRDEIMSSQPSPYTPILMVRDQVIDDSFHRSPLTQRSTNVNLPMPTEEDMAKKPTKWTSSQASQRSLRSGRRTQLLDERQPARTPLAEIPVSSLDLGARVAASPLGRRGHSSFEIPDSEDEFSGMSPSPHKSQQPYVASAGDDFAVWSSPGVSVTPIPMVSVGDKQETRNEVAMPNLDIEKDSSELANEPVFEQVSPQQENVPVAEAKNSSNSEVLGTPSPRLPRHVSGASTRGPSIQQPAEIDDESTADESEEDGLQPGTPTPKPRRVQLQIPQSSPDLASQVMPRDAPVEVSSPLLPRRTQGRSQYLSQGLESQRVPLEIIREMGPQTDRSDVLVSIHPRLVDSIVKGTKNHDFRSVKIPDQVSRMWIYVTKPVMQLQYMATIGHAKMPGEIDDQGGEGNADFNRRKMKAKYAYELLQVYQLNNAVSLQTLKENGWAENAPSGHTYLPPAAIGQLLGNLRCALFSEGEAPTVSQELEDQIISDLTHSTQVIASDSVRGEDDIAEADSTSHPQDGRNVTIQRTPVKASAAIMMDSSARRRSPRKTPATARKRNTVRPSQATTASQVSLPAVSPEKSSVPRPTQLSSFPSLPELDDLEEDETPIRVPSGDLLLTSSSDPILQDSLLTTNVRHPPVVIWDSEDDEDGNAGDWA